MALTTAAGAAALALTLHATGALAERDPFHPALVVALLLGLLTIGRVLYVLDHDRFGLAEHISAPVEGHERTFAVAVLAQFACAALFALGAWAARTWGRRSAPSSTVPPDQRLVVAALVIVGLGAVASLAVLVGDAGGVRDYVRALDHRQLWFREHHGRLVGFLAVFPSVVLAWLALNIGALRGSRRMALVAAGLVALACVMAAATGVRSTLLFLFVVPVLALRHVRVRRIGLGVAVIAGVVAFLAAGAYRDATRDNDNPDARRLYDEGAKGIVTNTFAGSDAHLPDALATLMLGGFDRRWGVTIANAAVTPVPRQFWDGKPTGANEQFTRILAPGEFARTRTEYGITFAGELYWSFWWPGLAGFALLGLGAGAAHRRALARPDDALAALTFAAVLGTLLLLLRADAWNTAVGAIQAFVPGLVLVALARRRPA